ncbi:MAG: imidazole glycerol phosphate synthase subunit HisH [Gammaproteobacteria bacterium]|nr:imidazole glycerol phosphate synthase subunit HisH [Gammaproteobacteria bacterium]
MSIVVVDFGTGNLRSVVKALQHVAPKRKIKTSFDSEKISRADQIVMPGQGAMGSWMAAMREHDLRDVIVEAINTKPVLGICLGLQALYESSEEDNGVDGLGFFSGKVKRFSTTDKILKVPHMGWNNVAQCQTHPLWHDVPDNSRFYFVHSYYPDSEDVSDIAGETNYGISFTAAAARQNVFAVQFHPEKSHHAGLRLLRNFVEWDGARH